MYHDLFTLEVRNFRAIKEATIGLNGITVVAGINGSGKSTLSKLLYHTFRTAQNLEELILLSMTKELVSFSDYFAQAAREAAKESHSWKREWKNEDIQEVKKVFLQGLEEFKKNMAQNPHIATKGEYAEAFSELEGKLLSTFKTCEDSLEKRDISYFNREVARAFHTKEAPEAYSFYAQGQLITNRAEGRLEEIFFVDKVAYVDTPMVVGVEMDSSVPAHWLHLNKLLKNDALPELADDEVMQILKRDVLKGEVVKNKKFPYVGFVYRPYMENVPTEEYDLLECATGVRAIAILQLLLENGFLDKRTILILDEPEAHLHPEWIVEYARLVVLLHKKHGVKFFIATHSPDMVSALKYIGEEELKEDAEKRMGFYLAEEQKNGQFVFESLGMKVGRIHGSFNISLKKTNVYGKLKEKQVYLEDI